jgi:hypothetical protein
MKKIIEFVLDYYIDAYHNRSHREETVLKVEREFSSTIRELARIGEDYEVHGSVGTGNWAFNPWVGVFDREITDTARHGYYIVYLFDADMQSVSLSLNQGWTQYYDAANKSVKKAREMIQENSRFFQQSLHSIPPDVTFDPIALHPKTDLGKGYELGHICGKTYYKGHIPEDGELVKDLHYLIAVYRELKQVIGPDIMDPKNNERTAPFIEKEIDVSTVTITATQISLGEVNPKNRYTYAPDAMVNFDAEKELNKQKRNTSTGKAAEEIVVKYEQERLTREGRADLAKKVHRVSDNRAKGYDVHSYDADGCVREIEVKGSTQSTSLDFIISGYEMEAARKLPNYHIYHVHAVKSDMPNIQIIKHPDFKLPHFDVQPMVCNVRYTPKS